MGRLFSNRRTIRLAAAILMSTTVIMPCLAAVRPAWAAESEATPVEATAEQPAASSEITPIAAPADAAAAPAADSATTVDLAAPDAVGQAGAMSSQSSPPPSSGGSMIAPGVNSKQILPEPDHSTGALVYDYPIVAPPGRNGLQPDLRLDYNSQKSGRDSIFGAGWEASIPYIERQNVRGTDKLYTENHFLSSLSGELRLVSGSEWGAKVEDGQSMKYVFADNTWVVTDKSGTAYKFGMTAASRQDDTTGTKTYRWLLTETRDRNDNFVRYEYFKDQGQIYPWKIDYTGNGSTDGVFEVEFLRAARTDVHTDHGPAFPVVTAYCITEIQAKVNGSWVRKYALAYVAGDNGFRSLLSSITESGRDEQGVVTILPATAVQYQTNAKGLNFDSGYASPIDFLNGTVIADINGDGLADIIQSYHDGATWTRHSYLNNGNKGWTESSTYLPPIQFANIDVYGNITDTNHYRMMDANGDGLVDIICDSFGSNSYLNTGNGWQVSSGWNSLIPFSDAYRQSGYPWNFARVGDLNGDGLPDLFRSWNVWNGVSYVLTTEAYLNNGSGWSLTSGWQIPIQFDYGIQISDVNGDGLADIMQSYMQYSPSQPIKHTYINKGDGTFVDDSAYAAPVIFGNPGPNGDLTPPNLLIVDFNGDALPDILNAGGQSYLNSGSGWVAGGPRAPCNFVYPNHPELLCRTADISGDGLVDIFRAKMLWNGSIQTDAWLNTGGRPDLMTRWTIPTGGRVEAAYQATPQYRTPSGGLANPNLPLTIDTVRTIIRNDGLGSPEAALDQQLTNINIDANNTPFYIGSTQPWYNPEAIPSRIHFYAYVGDYACNVVIRNCLAFSEASNNWVCADSAINAPANTYVDFWADFQHPQVGNPASQPVSHLEMVSMRNSIVSGSCSYLYWQASYNNPLPAPYTGLSGQAVQGYSFDPRITITVLDGGVGGHYSPTTYSYEGGSYYFNGVADRRFAGFNKVKEVDAAGNVRTDFYHQGNATDSSNGEYQDDGWKIGRVYRTETADSSGNKYDVTVNRWDESDLGNGRRFVKLAQKTGLTYDGDADHRDRAETYAYDDATGNLASKAEWGEVAASADGSFTDAGTDKFSTAYSYAANAGAHVLGLVSRETVADQSDAQVKDTKRYYDGLALGSVDKGNLTKEEHWVSGTSYVNSQKSYDGTYGLVASETDPRGKVTTYSYDSYHLYPATVTNPLSQATQYLYDYATGQVKRKTDPNGRVFETAYDGLGRPTAENQPDAGNPTTLVNRTTYAYTDTAGAVSVKRSDWLDASTSADSYAYYDGLKRPVQERREAEGGDYAVKDTAYDSRGLMLKESLPYFSSGYFKTSPTTTAALYTTYAYDPLRRVTSAADAVGTTATAYDDWKTTVTDARGKAKDLYKDAYDRLARVDEHNSGATYTTTYAYDYLGGLTNLTDALGNVRAFTYDGLGRRLTAQDLHAPVDSTYGSWSYAYDDAGNLTSRTDARGQVVNWVYDDLNRPLTEDWTGGTGTEVTNTYDSGTDGIGRLTGVAVAAVTKSLAYDALGRLAGETATVDSTPYATSHAYDRQGHEILTTGPDGSQVKNLYNAAGLLEEVERKESTDGGFADVVSDFDYAPTGLVSAAYYANGAATANTYDAGHLYRLASKVTAAGGANVQSLAYTYDAVGNVTGLVDASSTDSAKTVAYAYDDLNRLLSATATNVAQGQTPYTQTFTYDAIGNILTGPAGTYSYDGDEGTSYANPHAATSIGSDALTYDNNGNLLTKGSNNAYVWDYQNRLASSATGVHASAYSYDANGQRVKLTEDGTATVFPSAGYEVTGSTPTKHISANGAAIAVVAGTGSSAVARYVATDHLTGSNVVMAQNGTVDELMDYYPYGSLRIDQKSGSFSERRKFAGHEFDAATSLSYMKARYYDPSIGRFLSQDPLFGEIGGKRFGGMLLRNQYKLSNPNIISGMPDRGSASLNISGVLLFDFLSQPQLLNSYSYVSDNPLKYTDPTGESQSAEKVVNFVSGRGWKTDAQLTDSSKIPSVISSPQSASQDKSSISAPGHAGDSSTIGPDRPKSPSYDQRNSIANGLFGASQAAGIVSEAAGANGVAGAVAVSSAAVVSQVGPVPVVGAVAEAGYAAIELGAAVTSAVAQVSSIILSGIADWFIKP